MKHIPERDYPDRSDMIMINDNFKELEESTGIAMEYINCGKEPNDATGDRLRDGMQKINRNFAQIEKHLRLMRDVRQTVA